MSATQPNDLASMRRFEFELNWIQPLLDRYSHREKTDQPTSHDHALLALILEAEEWLRIGQRIGYFSRPEVSRSYHGLPGSEAVSKDLLPAFVRHLIQASGTGIHSASPENFQFALSNARTDLREEGLEFLRLVHFAEDDEFDRAIGRFDRGDVPFDALREMLHADGEDSGAASVILHADDHFFEASNDDTESAWPSAWRTSRRSAQIGERAAGRLERTEELRRRLLQSFEAVYSSSPSTASLSPQSPEADGHHEGDRSIHQSSALIDSGTLGARTAGIERGRIAKQSASSAAVNNVANPWPNMRDDPSHEAVAWHDGKWSDEAMFTDDLDDLSLDLDLFLLTTQEEPAIPQFRGAGRDRATNRPVRTWVYESRTIPGLRILVSQNINPDTNLAELRVTLPQPQNLILTGHSAWRLVLRTIDPETERTDTHTTESRTLTEHSHTWIIQTERIPPMIHIALDPTSAST